ncbi:MAG TPA: endolytic transglycosylase MltG [Patescibacteria group bacterium]|nr:endolytic transglycosylase MltG [Patescibacteria group bacterium]
MPKIGKKVILGAVLVLLAMLMIGAGYGWWRWQARPAGKSGTIVEITADNFYDLRLQLSSKKLIGSGLYFAAIWGDKKQLPERGYYSLGGTDAKELKKLLMAGPNIVKLTIPEGFSAGQIAARLVGEGLPGEDFLALALPLEGKLFPETYFLRKASNAQQIIDKLTATYDDKTTELTLSNNDLILASIIEREAKKDEERPKIAALYLNRLAQGMKLEADPTVQYGRDLTSLKADDLVNVKLWQPLASGDTHAIVSKYNTYASAGLPPGPICNPGIKSLKAAKNPEAGITALYFFHDAGGVVHFTNSFTEHQAAIQEFGL